MRCKYCETPMESIYTHCCGEQEKALRIEALGKIIVEMGICASVHDPIDRCPYCRIEELEAEVERLQDALEDALPCLAEHDPEVEVIAREALAAVEEANDE